MLPAWRTRSRTGSSHGHLRGWSIHQAIELVQLLLILPAWPHGVSGQPQPGTGEAPAMSMGRAYARMHASNQPALARGAPYHCHLVAMRPCQGFSAPPPPPSSLDSWHHALAIVSVAHAWPSQAAPAGGLHTGLSQPDRQPDSPAAVGTLELPP